MTKIAVVDHQVCHGATFKLYLLSYHRIQLQETGSKAPVIHPGDEEPYLIWGWMGNAKEEGSAGLARVSSRSLAGWLVRLQAERRDGRGTTAIAAF